jgi:hypothetical protein
MFKYIIQSAERPQQPGVPLALQQTSSAGALAIFIGVTRVIFIVDVLVLQANSTGMLNRVVKVTKVASYIFSRSVLQQLDLLFMWIELLRLLQCSGFFELYGS